MATKSLAVDWLSILMLNNSSNTEMVSSSESQSLSLFFQSKYSLTLFFAYLLLPKNCPSVNCDIHITDFIPHDSSLKLRPVSGPPPPQPPPYFDD